MRVQGQSLRQIGAAIGRSPSTISRELRRNATAQGGYRATTAHVLAYERAARPKPAKLHTHPEVRAIVVRDLAKKYSPEQIAGRLRREFPDKPEMWVDVLRELATQVEQGAVYDRHLPAIAAALDDGLRAVHRRSSPSLHPIPRPWG